ncbi:conserved hypothetical protein [Chryseobacterium sp. 8AT]|nr:conserved hypothetical protein [Chryseobacterium sp. 8AT]
MTFNYIRNQIEKYKKKDLLDYCFYHLNNNSKTFSYFTYLLL